MCSPFQDLFHQHDGVAYCENEPEFNVEWAEFEERHSGKLYNKEIVNRSSHNKDLRAPTHGGQNLTHWLK